MVHKLPGFSLQYISERPYLLPYGQNAADHRKGMRLDSTGEFIWQALDDSSEENDLFIRFAAHEQLDISDFQSAKQEMEDFLIRLENRGAVVIDRRRFLPERSVGFYKGLSIAGLKIKLYGPAAWFDPVLDRFSDLSVTEHTSSDMTVVLTSSEPRPIHRARVLIKTDDLLVFGTKETLSFLYPHFGLVREVRFTRDAARAEIYVRTSSGKEDQAELVRQAFLCLRTPFFYLAAKNRMYAIHAASVLYQGRIWLFTGSNRQHQLTHVNLWNARYGTRIMNGDLNLIGYKGARPFILGIPWCGASGIFSLDSYPLGGVILLKPDQTDRLMKAGGGASQLMIFRRMAALSFNEQQLTLKLNFVENLVRDVPIFRYACTSSEYAVDPIKQAIDGHLLKLNRGL